MLKTMWKPLGVAAVALLALTGCGAETTAETVSPSATATPSMSTAVSPKEEAAAKQQQATMNTTIDPETVEVPEEGVEAFGDERTDVLAEQANAFIAVIDGFSPIQVPGGDIAAQEAAFKAAVGDKMDPTAVNRLIEKMKEQDGTTMIPMWVRGASVDVDGNTYTRTDTPLVVQYGEPLVEANIGSTEDFGFMKWSQKLRYLIPATDETGKDVFLSTDLTRSIDFQPGYTGQPWVVAGIWASESTPYKVLDGGAA